MRPRSSPLLANLDPSRIADADARRMLQQVLTVVEELAHRNAELQVENQALLVVDREQRLVCAAYRRTTFTHRVNTLNRDSRIEGCHRRSAVPNRGQTCLLML